MIRFASLCAFVLLLFTFVGGHSFAVTVYYRFFFYLHEKHYIPFEREFIQEEKATKFTLLSFIFFYLFIYLFFLCEYLCQRNLVFFFFL